MSRVKFNEYSTVLARKTLSLLTRIEKFPKLLNHPEIAFLSTRKKVANLACDQLDVRSVMQSNNSAFVIILQLWQVMEVMHSYLKNKNLKSTQKSI